MGFGYGRANAGHSMRQRAWCDSARSFTRNEALLYFSGRYPLYPDDGRKAEIDCNSYSRLVDTKTHFDN